ncbi:MAG: NAD(P)-dependent alcohol dehydrogenase, partial [Candidatus Thorarchaeota archaeon]
MKAMVTTKYGPIEVLQIQERETPAPRENEVLIKIHVTTVSIGDVKMRGLVDLSTGEKFAARLFLGWSKPKKDILGMEAAGEVEAIGSDVTKFKVGDRVFASTFWDGLGGYAQYKCIPEDSMIATIPGDMSYEQAVPVLGGGVTAAKILKKGNIKPGQKVLIYGASGNVGTYAVQIAKYLGAEVTGVCSTTNLELVKNLGADKVIDYTTTDFTQSGEMYDIVFDAVSKMDSSQRKVSKATGIYLDVDKDSGGVGKSRDHI